MLEPKFIHLHVNSSYSILQSTIKTDNLLKAVSTMGMPAVAMTDVNNLFGAFEFSDHACNPKEDKKTKAPLWQAIQPIIGCEIALKNPYDKDHNDFIILLVIDEKGYANLRRLDSWLFLRKQNEKGISEQFISFDELKECSEGLILLTGSVKGPLSRMFLAGNGTDAEKLLCDLSKIFKNRIYVELERHDLTDEKKSEPFLIEMAYKYNLPLVATNSVMFIDESYYEAHEAMLCIKEKTVLDDPNRSQSNLNFRLKTQEEMVELFSDIPEAINNTVNIAKRSHFMLSKIKPVLPKVICEDNQTEDDKLRIEARKGLETRLRELETGAIKRVAPVEDYVKRLEYELDVIVKMGFSGYFLIVAEFINWSKDNGVPVGPGRGSGAGSMVAWSIRITDLDPLRYGLLFERFLNPERVNMPDFDVDFCKEGRERTIAHVCETYGNDRVAQIITYGQMKAKAVVRDVGRVIGMGYNDVDKIAKLIPNKDKDGKEVSLQKALELVPELKEKVDKDENVHRLFDIALKLEGLHRNSGMHAAGIVIGNKPLEEIVPLYKDPDFDMPVAQFNMKYIESTSLVKFDFLGLKTLTLLRDTVKLIGKSYDFLSTIPIDDKETYKMLADGDTNAVFQFESGGMKGVLKNMKPDCIEDLVAAVALYRPGPMGNIPTYIARKHGKEAVDYIYPSLEPILKETYGIIIYQEQVMQISQIMAGYSLGSADLLRRAMGKKIAEEMAKQEPLFIDGAVERGVPAKIAGDVFALMKKFAEYGFNKSHAAAYAWVSYQTAYLKCHYRIEFMCASMSSEKGDTEKLNLFRKDCENFGIAVLPPCINHSYNDFMPEDGKIRYAFSAIKGVGEKAGEAIQNARNDGNGLFKSLSDFLRRVDSREVNRKTMENMIKAGVFDCFDPNRKKLLFNLDAMMGYSAGILSENQSSQISFFGMDKGASDFELKNLPNGQDKIVNNMDKLNEEKSVIGFFLSDHPLKNYETALNRLRADKVSLISDTLKISHDARFRLGVIITKRKKGITKSGKPYRIYTFSDIVGECEVFCWEDVYETSKELLDGNDPLFIVVSGKMSGTEDKMTLTLHMVEKLSDAAERSTSGIIIGIDDDSNFTEITSVLNSAPEGKMKVILSPLIKYGDRDLKVEIELKKHYHLSSDVLDHLRSLDKIKIEEL